MIPRVILDHAVAFKRRVYMRARVLLLSPQTAGNHLIYADRHALLNKHQMHMHQPFLELQVQPTQARSAPCAVSDHLYISLSNRTSQLSLISVGRLQLMEFTARLYLLY